MTTPPRSGHAARQLEQLRARLAHATGRGWDAVRGKEDDLLVIDEHPPEPGWALWVAVGNAGTLTLEGNGMALIVDVMFDAEEGSPNSIEWGVRALRAAAATIAETP